MAPFLLPCEECFDLHGKPRNMRFGANETATEALEKLVELVVVIDCIRSTQDSSGHRGSG
jgi:hypothetical protein